MEIKVKKLQNFSVTASGIYTQKCYVAGGYTPLDAEARAAKQMEFVVQSGVLTSQNNGSIFAMNLLDEQTLRNIAAVAITIADRIRAVAGEDRKLEGVRVDGT